ncbi:putative pyrrolidone-carboxylate peptidase-like isoform 2 [Capsicum annuum]|nr:putative pyrrolidone-carboxylate peptidase-like isoform 2 [Capsicum annuum]
MGSEGPSPVTVHVTGFGKFHGVSDNPTETIVGNLTDYMKKRGMPKGLILGSCSILDSAGQGAIVPLYQTLQAALRGGDSESSNSRRVIWVHFGVKSDATMFAIENQAVNEATFCCPDEMGWQPQVSFKDLSVFIGPVSDCSSSSTELEIFILLLAETPYCSCRWGNFAKKRGVPTLLFLLPTKEMTLMNHDPNDLLVQETSLPVEEMTKVLAEMGYEVMTSHDADRFVCNYVYYHSLRFAEQNDLRSLFVHVPLFLTIDEETQMQFAASLLELLASLY